MQAIDIQSGDLVEIKYLRVASDGENVFPRWIAGEVIHCEADAWPLVRLNDGQLTEIRPFMEWRMPHGSRRRNAA